MPVDHSPVIRGRSIAGERLFICGTPRLSFTVSGFLNGVLQIIILDGHTVYGIFEGSYGVIISRGCSRRHVACGAGSSGCVLGLDVV